MSYARAKGWQTKPKPGCFIDPTHPLSRGLVGCWLFNEGAGSRLTDYSGYGNHGALTNMNANNWAGSFRGCGLTFDGNDNYVNIDSFSFNPNYRVSIHCYVLLNYQIANNASIIGKRRYFAGGHEEFPLLLGASADVILCNLSSGDDYDLDVSLTTGSLELNRWHCISFTHTNNSHKLYLNANIVDSSSVDCVLSTTSQPWRIGASPELTGGVNQTKFYGVIGDIRIYDYELCSNEIKWLYFEPYANILQPTWRKYFVPMTIGGNASRFAHQYRQRRNFV